MVLPKGYNTWIKRRNKEKKHYRWEKSCQGFQCLLYENKYLVLALFKFCLRLLSTNNEVIFSKADVSGEAFVTKIKMLKRFTDPYMHFIKYLMTFTLQLLSMKLLIDRFCKGRSERKYASLILVNYLWIELDNKYPKQLLATWYFVSIVTKVYLILVAVLNGRREGYILIPFDISDSNIYCFFNIVSCILRSDLSVKKAISSDLILKGTHPWHPKFLIHAIDTYCIRCLQL